MPEEPLPLPTTPILAEAQRAAERVIVEQIRHKYNAESEVRLFDGTRVDMLSFDYAYEVDFAAKWAEAVGQALWYAIVTGRRPAIVLLVRPGGLDDRYLYRCLAVAARCGIAVFTEDANS